jgi:carbamoyltransferase
VSVILGISCFYHDAAAALLRDGILIAAAEEERFSRKKHDYGFPHRAIDFCLAEAGLTASEVEYAVFYEKPFLKFERLMMSILQTYPRSWKVFREAMITWLHEKLWIKALIREKLRIPEQRILFVEHHLSHAASAFFCSPFEEAAVLTVDGVGEWATATQGVGRGNELRLTAEQRFPHSVGLLYSAFTAFLGFEVNEGEYKVMGMAPYGRPRYVDKVTQLVEIYPDGSIRLDMDYFSFHHSTTRTFSRRFETLFGEPRDSKASEGVEPYYADVAASIQSVTEEIVLKMVTHLCRETNQRRLCLAGGVAMNSVANGRILRETPIEELFIHPAPGDSGGAIGAALYAHHVYLGRPRQFIMDHAAWGKGYAETEILAFLDREGIRYQVAPNEEALLDPVIEALVNGKVVGWMQGRFEWGPRALGQRSILGDPRRAEMKEIVNSKIKFREPFRPFAPSVLAERVEEFFDLTNAKDVYPARFMQLVVPVREEARDRIPATTHVDGTGRLQAVHRDTNSLYYQLIERFGQATGVPVVLNTSFNLRGEPIVASPADAFSTFQRSGIDLLVLGNCLVEKG